MQMAPLTEMCQDIEIRYSYSVSDDMFHAHFTLPPKSLKHGFQRVVRLSMSPEFSDGKHHFKASSEVDVLKRARTAISSYFKD